MSAKIATAAERAAAAQAASRKALRNETSVSAMTEQELQNTRVYCPHTGTAKKGDIYVIPDNPTAEGVVLKDDWGAKKRDGSPIYAAFLYVTRQEDGTPVRFYPKSVLDSVVFEVDKEGMPTESDPIRCSGTAAATYQAYDNMFDGLNALAGTTIKITDVRFIRTNSFAFPGTTQFKKIFVVDIIKKAPKTSKE